MSAEIRIAKNLLSKTIVRIAQAEPAAAPAAEPGENPAPAPAPAPAAPAPADAQQQQAQNGTEDWVKLENIIKELQQYHNKQSQYGDRISIQVADDPKSKKFTITIRKSDLVKPGQEQPM